MFMREELVVMDEGDNVGIMKKPANAGQKVGPVSQDDDELITLKDDIPFGFKVAIRDIQKGDKIIKFGEAIGIASVAITKGEMVHVHNIEGLRGRGDLEKGALQ